MVPSRAVTHASQLARRSTRHGPSIATLAGAVFLLAALVHGAALWNGFVEFDDPPYVTSNPHVQSVSWVNVRWAFAAFREGNWHPITWLSHMVDRGVFGLAPAGHHATSVLIHAANSALLFAVLSRLTGARWPSLLAAALFAVHPINVESVAWISQRKNVLSTFFWLATLHFYVSYVRRPVAARYAFVAGAFALGLMTKPMLVTLPCTLLLLDYWPLARLSRRAVVEKLPLFALAAASCVVTVAAQRSADAVTPIARLPLDARAANAAVSYVRYLAGAVWPAGLAAHYPLALPDGETAVGAPAIAATLLLVAITVIAFRMRRAAPGVLFGWLWYLGTLVPVIGLVQVGGQARADRYAYVPLIGVFVAAAWSVDAIVRRAGGAAKRRAVRAMRPRVAAGACAAVVAALALASARQIDYWRDTITLFERSLAVSPRNAFAHNNLGVARLAQGRIDDALAHYRAAIDADPSNAHAHSNLGQALLRRGDLSAAEPTLREAVRLAPRFAEAHHNLGLVLSQRGDIAGAISAQETALRVRPDYAGAHVALGSALDARGAPGDADAALAHLVEAVHIDPVDPIAHNNLGAAWASRGRIEEAIVHFREALRLSPGDESIRRNLDRALAAR
jgi:Flp pilus assembly protein TadD